MFYPYVQEAFPPSDSSLCAKLLRRWVCLNCRRAAASSPLFDSDEDDPVARAVAKRAAQQAEDASNPASKFIRAVESAEQRVAKATSRLADAKANNDENVDAFAKGLEKAQDKLAASKQALSEFQADEQTWH